MAGSGHHNGNGNGNGNSRTPWNAIGAESFGLGIAELVSMGVSLGVVGIADDVAPSVLKHSSRMVGKILEPYLENIERGLQKVCKLEECKPDLNQSREKRAETLAHTILVFSAAWAISMAAKLGTRVGMNSLLKVSGAPKTGNWFQRHLMPKKHDLKVVAWDESVHIGSLLFMNTAAAKYTDDMIVTTTDMLQRWGMSEKRAKNLASMGIIWELPNALGWFAGVGAIAHDRLKNNKTSHVEQLASSTALTNPTHTL
jgi:hypothetical protein